MKKIAFIVMGCVMAVGVSAASGEGPSRGEVVLTSPVEWQVFQRTSATEGRVRIAGHVNGGTGRPLTLFMSGKPGDSSAVPVNSRFGEMADVKSGNEGSFEAEMKMPVGGWHSLYVGVSEEGKDLGQVVVQHVGVGEVFVVGGQSNSTNYGEVKTKTETGMVTVFDGKSWTVAADPLPGVDGKGGSPWCAFGDALVGRLHVPVGIVPVGRGSTSVRQWLPKGDAVAIEPSRDYGLKKLGDGTWESEGVLFDRMVERMKALGPNGFRAMLWHQGESDAHQTGGHTLPGVQYRAMLERVIRESRKEVGREVPWFVAKASWGSPETPADPDIRGAQQGVVTDGVAMAGPDTDTLLGENRQKNGTGVHMSAVGLKAHGELWAGVVGKWLEGLAAK